MQNIDGFFDCVKHLTCRELLIICFSFSATKLNNIHYNIKVEQDQQIRLNYNKTSWILAMISMTISRFCRAAPLDSFRLNFLNKIRK